MNAGRRNDLERLAMTSASHRDQLRSALLFFRSRVKGTVEEVRAAVQDIEESAVDGDVFNRDDVLAILEQTQSAVVDVVRTDLDAMIGMNGLLLSQLYEGAEDQGVSLITNLSRVEDRELLAGMTRLEQDASSGCLSPSTKLSSSRDDSLRMARENRTLKEENAGLRAELAKLHASGRSSSLAEGGAVVEESSSSGGGGGGGGSGRGGGGRFADSREYLQMKRILDAKNATVRQLRERLAKFEADDDDDFV
jgi:uncharacterized membrane protein YgcG